MKKTEIVLLLLVLIAMILDVLGIAGAGALLALSICILSSFYYGFGFALFNGIKFRNIFKKTAYQNTNWKRIVFAIFIGITISFLFIGILFRMQNWPGSGTMLIAALCTSAFFLPIAIIKFILKRSSFLSKILLRLIVLTVIVFILYLMPASTIIDIKYKNNPDLKYMNSQLNTK